MNTFKKILPAVYALLFLLAIGTPLWYDTEKAVLVSTILFAVGVIVTLIDMFQLESSVRILLFKEGIALLLSIGTTFGFLFWKLLLISPKYGDWFATWAYLPIGVFCLCMFFLFCSTVKEFSEPPVEIQ